MDITVGSCKLPTLTFQKAGSSVVAAKNEGQVIHRKEWAQPRVKKLEAGAAETGTRTNEDNNADALNARS